MSDSVRRQRIGRGLRRLGAGRMLGVANRLDGLVALYGDTDKGEHGYLKYYRRHLGRLRTKKLTVLEIGVGGYTSSSPSGSLPVWRDYFVRSQIVGVDIEEKVFDFGRRVHFERIDQSSVEDLTRLVAHHGVPDVVIDDGSHIGRHIWASFEHLWPLMGQGAVYVIEDLSTSYHSNWEGDVPAPPNSAVGLLQELVDSVQASDPISRDRSDIGVHTSPRFVDVASVSVYPGIAFIEKA